MVILGIQNQVVQVGTSFLPYNGGVLSGWEITSWLDTFLNILSVKVYNRTLQYGVAQQLYTAQTGREISLNCQELMVQKVLGFGDD